MNDSTQFYLQRLYLNGKAGEMEVSQNKYYQVYFIRLL